MSETLDPILDEAQQYIMNTYGRFPLALDHGEGVYLYDRSGKKYLDMCAGIAVNALGYGNEKLIGALKAQMEKFFHVSNLYYTEPQIKAAKKLVENSIFDKVFFCNSGAEANEAALKLARKYGKTKSPSKTKVISMEHSFHGRTYGALSATGQIKYQKSFLPTLEGFAYAQYNDIESLKSLLDQDVCAVMLEVIQGEGGIIPAEVSYLQAVQKLCKEYDALLIVDEVQTGIGRCGTLFAFENFGIEPDVISLAKGLGGGVPIGAMLCKKAVDVLVPGDHASTFGGNPLATTAAQVILKELLETDLLAHVKKVGAYLTERLNGLKDKYPCVKAVRGLGLMQGIQIEGTPKTIINACIEKGLLIVGAGTDVIRFVPPLIITEAQIDEGIKILEDVLKNYSVND